ncbi:4-diphosphocytidyl-2-C-methyl-D-erythritol kinase [Meinhardsimonia xiamenensis]|jgi:4-diphosphocytidyl-2-C-methyl-D-erythritol kinase|uniref:4-diphosphocytidyl-2-C-methyl-D-erythritol kinase n=1 Tax=Meinhardsimonia xiamenensis TaxID=990712 RepID=A0A1G8YIU3_9RHOB|nr:4-(cytidine 5'-diphospho)-2-C-methyl-D-erythritol kinase [Meinhardsimonia xiamenensis]PRX37299.1 4-diphosphocytidyl-2-C-methyl-D-erythritol kinase [Meinhardsimonia xiamenensis]SDK02020.1 4-diphosphocytidyl-2-C-methyl-D-erythritol kinase [Meinhardsimonia xiamenensis]
MSRAIEVFAPAKINLTLHVTGRRADGLHLLDSLVVFLDAGDRLRLESAPSFSLEVTGPLAAGVPVGEDNLAMRAARLMGGPAVAITLEKHLPAAAGIGGGSADAAALLRGLAALGGTMPAPEALAALGADLPVCLRSRPARMRGIGERLEAVELPEAHFVLVNPGVAVPTAAVFAALESRDNPPMPEQLPRWGDAAELAGWLGRMRNDLEPAASRIAPQIGEALDAITGTRGCLLARMSGSGATCFGLYASAAAAGEAAARLGAERPAWWITPAGLWRGGERLS